MIQIGAIPVLTNYALRDKEVTGIIERSEAIAYVYSKEILGYSYKSMAERIKKRNRELLFIISVAEIEMSSFSDKNIILETPEVTDIIKGDIVLGDLPKLNIDLNISEYVMQEESFDDEFEEGTI